jgi:predicted RecA/RadA family phage recombinase
MYNEIQTNGAPTQRKFNGDYGFPFIATADEVDAGSVIVRGKLIGFSHRNVEVGQPGTAELKGTVTINKAAATVFAQGDLVYWDAAAKLATTSGSVQLGLCKFAPSESATTVEVLTNVVSNGAAATPTP